MSSPAGWNPEYVAYATAHGLTPEDMDARDRESWPDRAMTGFARWTGEQRQVFAKANPGAMFGAFIEDWDAWFGYLRSQARTAALALRAAPLIEYDIPGEGLISLSTFEPADVGSFFYVVE